MNDIATIKELIIIMRMMLKHIPFEYISNKNYLSTKLEYLELEVEQANANEIDVSTLRINKSITEGEK